MARKFFRRFMPSREKVDSDRGLKWLRPIMNKPYLWHLNRHSVSRSVAWGMFWALIPIPAQSIPAILCTIKARGNVPLALAATWLSNPFTLIPHWWSAYLIGKFILRSPGIAKLEFTWEFAKTNLTSWSWLLENFWHFYLPLFVGSVIEGALVGGLGYLTVMNLWRWHSHRRWRTSRGKARSLPARNPALPASTPV